MVDLIVFQLVSGNVPRLLGPVGFMVGLMIVIVRLDGWHIIFWIGLQANLITVRFDSPLDWLFIP